MLVEPTWVYCRSIPVFICPYIKWPVERVVGNALSTPFKKVRSMFLFKKIRLEKGWSIIFLTAWNVSSARFYVITSFMCVVTLWSGWFFFKDTVLQCVCTPTESRGQGEEEVRRRRERDSLDLSSEVWTWWVFLDMHAYEIQKKSK